MKKCSTEMSQALDALKECRDLVAAFRCSAIGYNDGGRERMSAAVTQADEVLDKYEILKEFSQPDIDLCSECGEHCEFEETKDGNYESNCCGAGPVNTDPDLDMER